MLNTFEKFLSTLNDRVHFLHENSPHNVLQTRNVHLLKPNMYTNPIWVYKNLHPQL